MRSVDSSTYTKEYFLNHCINTDEIGSNERIKRIFEYIKFDKKQYILDLGCGNGALSIYLAGKGARVIGIDYSKDAIKIANGRLAKQKNLKNVKFYRMDAKRLQFDEDMFDIVVSVDVFEHLYPEELTLVMKNISRVLRRGGLLLVHTEANRRYLDITHKYYVYPVSSFLIWLNRLITGKKYPGLPKDPRNKLHKAQHVNEPTYFYLKKLFSSHRFEGKIFQAIPLKPLISWKDLVFNLVVWLYPISLFPPLVFFFSYDFICIMKNKKL